MLVGKPTVHVHRPPSISSRMRPVSKAPTMWMAAPTEWAAPSMTGPVRWKTGSIPTKRSSSVIRSVAEYAVAPPLNARWGQMAPLGKAVVPEVKMMYAGSSEPAGPRSPTGSVWGPP
jgi:hypothetical protein